MRKCRRARLNPEFEPKPQPRVVNQPSVVYGGGGKGKGFLGGKGKGGSMSVVNTPQVRGRGAAFVCSDTSSSAPNGAARRRLGQLLSSQSGEATHGRRKAAADTTPCQKNRGQVVMTPVVGSTTDVVNVPRTITTPVTSMVPTTVTSPEVVMEDQVVTQPRVTFQNRVVQQQVVVKVRTTCRGGAGVGRRRSPLEPCETDGAEHGSGSRRCARGLAGPAPHGSQPFDHRRGLMRQRVPPARDKPRTNRSPW
jgi:hypothetical protein